MVDLENLKKHFYITNKEVKLNFEKHRIYWLQKYNVIIFSTPKAANTSIMKAIFEPMGISERFPVGAQGVHYINPRQAYYLKKLFPQTKVLCLLRDPKKRLLSCYNDSILRGEKTGLTDWGYPFYSNMSYEEFANSLTFIPTNEIDMHGRPVTFETRWNGEELVDEYIIVDDLRTNKGKDRVIGQLVNAGLVVAPIGVENVTPKKEGQIDRGVYPTGEWFLKDKLLYKEIKERQGL